MLQPTNANPLGHPLEEDEAPHQLRLSWSNRLDGAPRTTLCTPRLEYQAASQWMFYFNALTQPHQVAASLILEEDNTSHTQMDVFIRASPEARNAALHNSAHRNDNTEIVFQEMSLGIIINFIAY